MKYDITLASYAICNPPSNIPIPGTEKTLQLDTETGMGKIIWWGYLEMRTAQEKNPTNDEAIRVKVPHTQPEIEKFEEALNIFNRFMAGEGRDNCYRVQSIRQA